VKGEKTSEKETCNFAFQGGGRRKRTVVEWKELKRGS